MRELEILVTRTGLDVVKHLWPAQYTGKGGLDVQGSGRPTGPAAYVSMMVPNCPNMFMIYGPNSQALSGNPGLPMW